MKGSKYPVILYNLKITLSTLLCIQIPQSAIFTMLLLLSVDRSWAQEHPNSAIPGVGTPPSRCDETLTDCGDDSDGAPVCCNAKSACARDKDGKPTGCIGTNSNCGLGFQECDLGRCCPYNKACPLTEEAECFSFISEKRWGTMS